MELKVGNILPKLDMNAAPGPCGLRNTHLRIWTGAFATASTEEAIRHMEELLMDMASDKVPVWCMQAMQSTELMALMKATKKQSESVADHRPVQIPNTLAKVGDKAMLEQCQMEYVREMLSQQVRVGVKFAAELLAMGLKMTLHLHVRFIIITSTWSTHTMT